MNIMSNSLYFSKFISKLKYNRVINSEAKKRTIFYVIGTSLKDVVCKTKVLLILMWLSMDLGVWPLL